MDKPDITTAMTLEALNANMIPYDAKLHEYDLKGLVETAVILEC